MKKSCLLACLIVVISLQASAADNTWVEVRSPHFRVLSDGSERDARAVAGRFEQIRTAFATALPWLRLDVPVPLLVLAAKDEGTLKTLLPEMWKRAGVKPGGFFAQGSERSFAVVRLDVVRRQSQVTGDGYQVVYHEYTHSLLNANFRWLPLWLNEGLAEFFGNTQFEDDKIYLGAPNIRAEYTRGRPLLPLEKLNAITLDSPEYHDADKVQVFYSESWGLVHFLLVPDAMERGKRLQQLLASLEKGVEPAQAFREAVGDFKDIEERLTRYLGTNSLDVLTSRNPSPIPQDTFSARQLSPSESNAELGTFQVWMHENAAARKRLDQALKDNPRPGLGAEAMAFLKFDEGKDSEALALFDRAVKLDGKLYLSAYYRTMLTSAARADLQHVLELNPAFAPAYAQLAEAYVREGNLESALSAAVKAQQLWPSKVGYHILIGRILEGLGRRTEAAAVGRYVAERWPEPAPTPGTRIVRGKITSASCREKDQTMRIVIDGMPLTLRANDGKMQVEVSDTVWYGADHFNRCYHLDGLSAVIHASSAGDLIRLQIR